MRKESELEGRRLFVDDVHTREIGSGEYRAMTAWVSKEEHLPGIKTLIDRILTPQ